MQYGFVQIGFVQMGFAGHLFYAAAGLLSVSAVSMPEL